MHIRYVHYFIRLQASLRHFFEQLQALLLGTIVDVESDVASHAGRGEDELSVSRAAELGGAAEKEGREDGEMGERRADEEAMDLLQRWENTPETCWREGFGTQVSVWNFKGPPYTASMTFFFFFFNDNLDYLIT